LSCSLADSLCNLTLLLLSVVVMLVAEQSGQNLKMVCGTVQSVLIRTLQRHSSVPCVMFAKEHPHGKQIILSYIFLIYSISDYAVFCCSILETGHSLHGSAGLL